MEKRWIYKDLPDAEIVNELSKAININETLAMILVQRNIQTYHQAKDFFRPNLNDLHDPFLMKDMDKAVSRLESAINNNEKILIYGDYDVDGTTSVAIVYGFLRNKYSNINFYIPDRHDEGYGISLKGIDYAAENNFSLIICLDCGIKAVDQIAYANSKNIDFIICDHHRPDKVLPNAYAILDPKRDDCNYPYKELSGCGIGFKLLQAYSISNNMPIEDMHEQLDLVAISVAADIVPINGENRIFVFHGLKWINKNPRPGIKALLKIAGFKNQLKAVNIVFVIAPRINATGRIGHAKNAVHLLLAKTENEAYGYAQHINDKNKFRKEIDATITNDALNMIENDEFLRNSKSTVLFKEDWHQGVIGIVASRCIEKYYKPTIILTKSNGLATGSARSVDGFDIYDAIAECRELLERFGGHKYAAGLSLSVENIPAFKQKFEQVVSDKITSEMLIPKIDVDLKINLKQINYKFYRVLSQFGPFGPENMQPVFVSDSISTDNYPRIVGGEHLKIRIKQNDSSFIDAIGFRLHRHLEQIKKGIRFSMAYTIEENEFRGIKSLQLNIKDIKYM